MIRRLSLGLIVLCAWVGVLTALSFAQQRGRTLEERVSSLEYEVASLKQQFGGYGRRDVKRDFIGVGETFRLSAVMKNGASFLLGSNLLWEIKPDDQNRTKRWGIGDSIRIATCDNPKFPYVLQNLTRQEQAEANYTGRSGY